MKIELLEEVDSTNEYIKRYLSDGEDVIVCAARQTGGKGTKGRQFLSEPGGVYLSFLTFYSDFPADKAFLIMAHTAVAVCKTAEKFGVATEIKWPNDVVVGKKKLCGILIENAFSKEQIKSSIVGIGLNVCNDLSSLNGIAISLSEAAARRIEAEEAREELIRNFCLKSDFSEYLSRAAALGREISVLESGREYSAIVRSVCPDGRLEVEEKGVKRLLSSAEIKL